jgi:hypothetical protein
LLAKAREYDGALGFWKNHCESRIRNVIEAVPSKPAVEEFGGIAEAWQYGWRQTFTSMSLLFPLVAQLEQLIPDSSAAAGAVGQDLIAGDDNTSQCIDDSIWELAELVRDSEAARRITAGEPLEAISAAPGGADFAASLERFVA